MEISKYQNENAILQLVKKDWNFLSFKEVLVDKTSTVLKIPQNAYLKSGTTAIIDQGVKMIGGYSDLVGSRGEKECIIFGDHTRILKYIHPPFYIGADGVKVLENKKEDIVRTKFIYYYLKTIDIPNTGYNRHFKFLKEIVIPIIDIDIQDKIIKVIEMSEKLRQNRQSQLKALDELSQSLFLEMFGDPVKNNRSWKVTNLENITNKIGSGATPRGGKESYKTEGISLIRSMNVHNGLFKYKDLAFIDENQAKKLQNVEVFENDILLNITGASVARSCLVPKKILPARVNQHVSIIRLNSEEINYWYFSYLLTSKSFQHSLWRIATSGGATREAITKDQLNKLEITLPPINLQNEFAEKIQVIETQKEQITQSLAQYEELHQALLQKAFRGELFQDATN